MTGSLRIAITADPELPVPPRLYGGIERVIDLLVRGLVERGHAVTLFAHAASSVPCELVAYRGASSRSRADTARNAWTVGRHVLGHGFDVVHSFGRVAYLLALLPARLPKLMTYQRAISPRSVSLGHRLSGGSLEFSAIGRHMTAALDAGPRWHHVPNGVPVERYRFSPEVPADAPLAFLGRIEPIKGTHLAIEVARRSGRRLVIAGNVPPDHASYFETEVEPHLDGDRIRYVGPVDDAGKDALLGSAAALLMPVQWDEPFGIVMAEALACGTPVLGLRRGAVPEVVEHGVSGVVTDDVDGLVEAVRDVADLDRAACRRRAETCYGEAAVVDGYLQVYRSMIARAGR